jgi:hypothetical protein
MAEVTLRRLEREVKKMDPNQDRDTDGFRAAVVALAGATVSTRIPDLVKFTGYDRVMVGMWVRNLRRAGVFRRDGKVACDWFEKDGAYAFWMDVCVALGWFERVRAGRTDG